MQCTIVLWLVLAMLYFLLAIKNYRTSRVLLRRLYALTQPGNSLVSQLPNGEEVGLESTIYKGFKDTAAIDTIGFVLASIAAIISIV